MGEIIPFPRNTNEQTLKGWAHSFLSRQGYSQRQIELVWEEFVPVYQDIFGGTTSVEVPESCVDAVDSVRTELNMRLAKACAVIFGLMAKGCAE